MPIIGTFSRIKDGYAGSLETLMLKGRVQITPNVRKTTALAPDYRIAMGATEIGAAWRKVKQGTDQAYLRVRLDDPAWPQPIWGILVETTDGKVVQLVWNRPRRGKGPAASVPAEQDAEE